MSQFASTPGVVGCEQVIGELSAYFDRELTPHLRFVIEGHLCECRNCAAIYDGVRNLLVLVTDTKNIVALPSGFSNRLYRLLKKQSSTR